MNTGEESTFRPRWVWGGTAVGLAGLVLLGVAASVRNWWLAVAGGLMLGAGVTAARHGRIWRDVHASGVQSGTREGELERVRHGRPTPGVRPGTMIQDERVMADSRRTEARHRIAVDSAPAHRNMGVAGGVLMLCAAIVLVAAQLSMYPNTRLGEENATFMFFPSAVLALSGLNVVARPAQSHRVAGVLGLVAGVAILVVALANPHQATGTWILELVGGAAGVLGAAPSLSRR